MGDCPRVEGTQDGLNELDKSSKGKAQTKPRNNQARRSSETKRFWKLSLEFFNAKVTIQVTEHKSNLRDCMCFPRDLALCLLASCFPTVSAI